MKTWCAGCGADLVHEPGAGWVDARSGDDGGTYDQCPANPGEGDLAGHSLARSSARG